MRLPWNLKMIAEGFGYPSVEQFCSDINCNSLSKQSERAIALLLGGKVEHRQKPYDVTDSTGKRVEVRNMNANVAFNPSSDIGSKRPFILENLYKKFDSIDSYIVIDVSCIKGENDSPKVYEIPVEIVRHYFEEGLLGKEAKIGNKPRKAKVNINTAFRFHELFPYEHYHLDLEIRTNRDYPIYTRESLVERLNDRD